MFTKKIIFVILSLFSLATIAQKQGAIEDAEITVEKDRKVVMPEVIKPFEKAAPVKNQPADVKQMVFDIPERKIKLNPPVFNPLAKAYETGDTAITGHENFVRIGAGNYGRLFGEGLVNTPQSNLGTAGLYFKHNNSSFGPVYGANSANNETEIGLNGKYVGDVFILDGGLGYDRKGFNFYGMKNPPLDQKSIKQNINTYSMKIGLENANKEAALDYTLHTGLKFLKDNYTASETDWGTHFNFMLPVTQNFYALVNSDAYITQRTDSLTNNRNLFRVKPTFIWKNNFLAITFGFNAVNESDKDGTVLKTNRTKGFPVLNIDYLITNGIYAFGGIDGDIQRNTLGTLLTENQWLGRKVNLLNTEKTIEYYGGTKGDIAKGFSYDVKVSFAKFKNFHVFNNTDPLRLLNATADTSKFEVLYDTGTLQNMKVNTNLYYKINDFLRSSLKVEYNGYTPSQLKKVYHMPAVSASWSNTLSFKNKLFVGTDFYYLSGVDGFNALNKDIKLKSIVDLNLKFNYQFSNHLSSFVYLNNLLGKTYQRYTYYQQQSLNFLVGISYGFSTKELF